MKLDVLVFAAHPDDAEMSCGGTIAKLISQGKKLGIVDLTEGELGTRGSAEIRLREAAQATEIMGIHHRENLGFRDGFFKVDESHKLAIVQRVRRFMPDLVIANSVSDRHPDHGRAAQLIKESLFLSGLRRIETEWAGEAQNAWRPSQLVYFIQDNFHMPDFVVDITDFHDMKMAAIKAYASQFYDPNSDEPESYISSQTFLEFLEARARDVGHMVGAKYGEGFLSEKMIRLDTPLDLV